MYRPLFPSDARALGVDWPYSIGRKASPNAGREVLLTSPAFGTGPFTELQIMRRFNLGNHVRQVTNAVRLAERIGAGVVVLPRGSVIPTGQVGAVRLESATSRSSSRRHLRGDFFYYEKLGFSAVSLERARVLAPLRDLVRAEWDLGPARPGLTIHLRGGDVFSKHAHPLYAPPPLAFFEEAFARSGEKDLMIVTQDLDHPYVQPLKQLAQQREMQLQVSSSDLMADMRILCTATSLVISQGTLSLAAAWLSPHVRNVYAYNRTSDDLSSLLECGVSVQHARSELDRPWTGTVSHLNDIMMVSGKEIAWEWL